MRPTGITPRPTLVTAWQRKPNRNAALKRIQALSQELAAVQTEMHHHLASPVAGKPAIFLEDAAAVQALNDLQAELDQLRRILWFYLEEAAEKPQAAGSPRPRRERAATPGALAPQSGAASASEEPSWFFDRLNLVIDSYIQKKPVAAETKPLPRADSKAFL